MSEEHEAQIHNVEIAIPIIAIILQTHPKIPTVFSHFSAVSDILTFDIRYATTKMEKQPNIKKCAQKNIIVDLISPQISFWHTQ